MKAPPLREVVAALRKHHGAPRRPPTADAFELLLRENAAYIVDDDRRDATFAALKRRVGATPARILAAKKGALAKAIEDGGMLPPMRAEKVRKCARLAREIGDLDAVLDRGGREAKRALKRFPGIGDPGVEKVMLLSGREPVLALESNGLRVLLRLGFGRDEGSYPRTWKSVRAAVDPEVPAKIREVQDAHLLLRRHGRTLCRDRDPLCAACPLRPVCPSGRGDIRS